jgi:hypothetical protein
MLLLSISSALAGAITTVAALPSTATSVNPLSAENLPIFTAEVVRCVEQARKEGAPAWYGTATGSWTPSVKTVQFDTVVPRADFDAWAPIANCVGTGGQTYPYPGSGAFTFTIAPEQTKQVSVGGMDPEIAEEVRLVALGCAEPHKAITGRFVLSRHGSTKLSEVYADVLYQPNEALLATAACVAGRVGPRTSAPTSTEGYVVSFGTAGPAVGPASKSVANGKAFAPKSLIVRNSPVDEGYLILELREKKLSCDAAVKSKDLAFFVHAPKTSATVEVGRDPYVAAWWGDRQNGREAVFASSAKISANPNAAAGTATATVEAAGPMPSEYGLLSTTVEGVYCFN